jgi:hypothetical protein
LTAAHWIATFATALVEVIVAASICATIGASKQRLPRRFFLIGALGALAGTILGGLLQVATTIAPIVIALGIHGAPKKHEPLGRPHRRNLLISRLAVVLIVTLLPYAALMGGLASIRRTSTSQPKIVAQAPIDLGSFRGAFVPGTLISYTFTVDGRTVMGEARRSWKPDEIASAKVCYDPDDVAGSHVLELADFVCGSFALQPNG